MLPGLADKLLALVASTSWDGAQSLVRALAAILEEIAPFEVGELIVLKPEGPARLPLNDLTQPWTEESFLRHACGAGVAMRFGDLGEMTSFPGAHDRMAALGLRSLLTVPLSAAGGPAGVLLLGHRHGWAFAGASIRDLWPVAAMTGLCLERAEALTRLRREVERLGERQGGLNAEREAAQQELRSTVLRVAPSPDVATAHREQASPSRTAEAALHAQIETLSENLVAVESHRDELREALTAADSEREALRQTLAAAESDRDVLRAKVESLSETLAAAESDREQWRTTAADLRARLHVSETRSARRRRRREAVAEDPHTPGAPGRPVSDSTPPDPPGSK